MKVNLYLNSAETHKVDKTSDLVLVAELDGTLRNNCDILSPIITLQLPFAPNSLIEDEDAELVEDADGQLLESETSEGKVLEFNYAYIPQFHRYYFVSSIGTGANGLYVVSLSVDVLMSFKDYFLQLDAVIERNEFEYDALIDDISASYKMSDEVTFQTPANVASDPIEFNSDLSLTDYNFVINFMSADMAYNTDKVTPPSGSNLPEISSACFTTFKTTNAMSLSTGGVMAIAEEILNDDTLNSYVKTLIAFPFEVPVKSNTTWDVKLGNKTIHADAKYTKSVLGDYLEVLRFKFPAITSYDMLPPYTRYELFIPFYGYVELDAKLLSNRYLSLYYVPNYEDGSADVFLYDISEKRTIFTASCQLGVKLAFDSTNNREITDQRNAIALSTAVSVLGGVLSLGLGVGAGNPIAIAGGAMKITSSVASAINANAMLYDKAQVGFSSGTTALYTNLKPFLRIRKKTRLVEDEQAYAHAYGKPLMQSKLLSSLAGFTIVSSIHLTGVPAFKAELDEIERLLKLGVLL